jgi:hypothetical protein
MANALPSFSTDAMAHALPSFSMDAMAHALSSGTSADSGPHLAHAFSD